MKLPGFLTTAIPVSGFLFSIAVLATLPTLLFAGYLLLRYADNERARAESGLEERAKSVAGAIDAQFTAAEAVLTALRSSVLLDTGDLAGFELRLRRTTADTGRYFALLDPSGQEVINTILPAGEPLSNTDPNRWAPVFKERRAYVTDVFMEPNSHQFVAAIGVPVIRDGTVKWALTSGLFAKDFLTLAEFGAPNDWIVSIVDRIGTHLVRSRGNEEFAGKPLVPALVQHVKNRDTGTLRTTSLEGISLISTVAYSTQSNWAAAIGMPLKTLDAPLRSSLNQLLLSGFLVAAGSIMLAFLAARHINRALRGLSTAAESLGRGEVVASPRSMVQEVNDVGGVLARASRDLNLLTTSLETQVSARTAELTDANTKLAAEMKQHEESETKVRQLQKIEAIGKLTGGIAHDFNNMLAIVLGHLRLLQRRLDRGETNVQKYIDGAILGAERAATLTSRLLAFSRQQALAPEAVDCNKLLLGMNEILRRTIPESIQIKTVLAGGLWQTHADAQGIESAIINLAINARDAMPAGGKLTIETANAHLDDAYAAAQSEVLAGHYVIIAVTDTGTGMPADVVSRAFDPFFTTKPPGQGTGLGLSQVYGFINQSGGHVKIYSEAGQGTSVKLYLPRLSKETQTSQLKQRDTADIPVARNKEVVLVVEDDGEVRKLTAELLGELGYFALQAEDAAAALPLLEAHPEVALLITDVVMPGMNGRQLADEVFKRRPDIPVLFTTGYTRNAIVHQGVLDSGVHLIAKPHTLNALAVKISELLQLSSTPKKGT